MEKYNGFSVSDFLDDDDFLRWLSGTSPEDNSFWNEFLRKYPSKRGEIKEATLVYRLLLSNEDKLGINETYELWNKIQKETKHSKRTVFIKFLSSAAIWVLVFISGALAFYFYQSSESKRLFQLAENPGIMAGKAMIILSDGSKIPLDHNMSQISYSSNGQQLIINNDTIKSVPGTGNESTNRIIIPYGKKSMVQLSDGTRVWLNAGSQLIYPAIFTDKTREVALIGEAYFDVAHNHEKPFFVKTNELRIQVLGTKFDVSAYPEDKMVQTVLEEGRVNIQYIGKGILKRELNIEMSPNQMVQFDKLSGEVKSQIVNVNKYISWKNGMLEFEKVDLVRALKQVERFYNVRIILADPMVGSFKLSGKLDLKDDPEDVLNVIKLTVPIDWQRRSNGDFLIYNR